MTSSSEAELAFLPVADAARLLRRKNISPVDLVNASLARIERFHPFLNPFLTILAERAQRQARLAEREIHHHGPRGPLHGIPISLKDNFWTRGIRTTAGAKILADFVPERDSEVAARLAEAGAILLGKTNMHEFAYGITSENPHFGPVHNPWAYERISGGSSGGSGVAVATGMGMASMGTDTGGSIRIPAALCGIVGLKPTFGLVSVAGVVPLVQSLDHAGPLARSVVDACILLEAVAGQYPKGTARPDYRKLHANRPRKFRLGWPKQYYFERVDGEVRQAIDAAAKKFQTVGARITKISLPHLADSAEPSTNMAMAEATWFHESQGYFPARAGEYGKDVRHRLEAGEKVRAVDYLRAFDAKRALEQDFSAAFQHVDAILAPASPIPAPRIGQEEIHIGAKMETVRSLLVGTSRPANFTGLPAISVPCGFTREGLPVGLQLIGPRWSEARLLAIALAYEEATEWHQKHP
ncbi:MAG TPA: amidase [Candidatus Acidoferrales bacterium]|nr:amidase [Candidatus Acidoferrales bacterium]